MSKQQASITTMEMKMTNYPIYNFIDFKDIKIEKQEEGEMPQALSKSEDIEECLNNLTELLMQNSDEISQVKEEEDSDIESQIVVVYEHDPNTGTHTTCINPSINHKKEIMQEIYQMDDSPQDLTTSFNTVVTTDGKKKNICLICGKTTQSSSHHMLVHTNSRQFTCSVCNKAFKELPTLRRHMNTHLDKQYQCDICNKKFSEKSSLRRHLWTMHNFNNTNKSGQHPAPNNKFHCEKCNRYFRFLTQFNMHVAKHNDPRFECNICQKVFAGRSHLKIHKRIHTNEKPFKCNLCHVAFTFKHVLKGHLRYIHKMFDTFQCYICFKSFQDKHELHMHARTHSEVHAIKMGNKSKKK